MAQAKGKGRARGKKKAGAGADFVGQEVVLTREVTKIEKVKGVCVAKSDSTVTLQFEHRGRLVTRDYPINAIKDVSIIEVMG